MDPPRERILVDGMNLIGSRPDGWWRDRPAAMARLVGRLVAHAERTGSEIEVVFDGRPHAIVEEAGNAAVRVGFAPGGPDAADRVIAERVRSDPGPGSILVVSSDKRLRNQVKAAGGRSLGAGEFRNLLGD